MWLGYWATRITATAHGVVTRLEQMTGQSSHNKGVWQSFTEFLAVGLTLSWYTGFINAVVPTVTALWLLTQLYKFWFIDRPKERKNEFVDSRSQ